MLDSFVLNMNQTTKQIVKSVQQTLFFNRRHSDWASLKPYFTVQAIFSAIIILNNSFVLLLFFYERKSIKPTHKYIISMVVNDLLTGILFIPTLCTFFEFELFYDPQICFINSSMGFFMIINSLTTILIASVDRYWSIAFPVHYRKHVNDKICNCKCMTIAISSNQNSFFNRYHLWIMVDVSYTCPRINGFQERCWTVPYIL